ncbi:uncharacterized protein [Littorina saxatilis]|uniref:uncharacterized protein n=1 Tax=Littorina saxatilis TaxID=31220 RepID=UPI0038B5A651
MTFGSGSTVGDSEVINHSFPTAMPIRALFLSGYGDYSYQIYFDLNNKSLVHVTLRADDPDGDSCNKEMPTTTDKITQETTEAATVNTNNVSKTMESSVTTSSNVQNSSKRAESAEITTESTRRSEKSQEESQESSRMTTESAAESSSVKKDLDAASTKSTAKSVESQGVTLGTTSESTAEPIDVTTEYTTKATRTTKINTAPNVSVALQTTSNEMMAEATDTYITPTVKNIDDQTKTMASLVTTIKAGVEDVNNIEDSGLNTATDVGHLATETATNTEAANNKWDSDLATATINAESNTKTQEKLAETHKTYTPPANKPLKFSRAQKGCNCILRRPSTKNNENGTSPLDEEDKKKQEALSTAVKKELAVEIKELSASVRKKVSTADKRPTTTVVGYVLAGVCFAPLGLIVLADIVNVFRYVYSAVKNKAY